MKGIVELGLNERRGNILRIILITMKFYHRNLGKKKSKNGLNKI